MKISVYQIDAFTIKNKSFSGNPAAVCLLECDDDISDEIKQKIAEELNQPMTAFISKHWLRNQTIDKENNRFEENSYNIRFFTARQEFKVCGHASVASSYLLYRNRKLNNNKDENNNELFKVKFSNRFGHQLYVTIDEKELITISMPSYIANIVDKNEKWVQNIIKYTLGPDISSEIVEEVLKFEEISLNCLILIKFKDSTDNIVNKVKPNFSKLETLDRNCFQNAVIVTQKSNFESNNIHFYSRVFSPWIGGQLQLLIAIIFKYNLFFAFIHKTKHKTKEYFIFNAMNENLFPVNEDPVCGSAHALLTPYWKQRLGIDGVLIAKQCSNRGGILECKLNGDRVELSGNAIHVFEGFINL